MKRYRLKVIAFFYLLVILWGSARNGRAPRHTPGRPLCLSGSPPRTVTRSPEYRSPASVATLSQPSPYRVQEAGKKGQGGYTRRSGAVPGQTRSPGIRHRHRYLHHRYSFSVDTTAAWSEASVRRSFTVGYLSPFAFQMPRRSIRDSSPACARSGPSISAKRWRFSVAGAMRLP